MRIGRRCGWRARRPTPSVTTILCSAIYRAPAEAPRCRIPGCSCARRVPRRASCWWRQPPGNGKCRPHRSASRMGSSTTRLENAGRLSARWSRPRRRCRSPTQRLSRTQRTTSSSAAASRGSTFRRNATVPPSSRSMWKCPECGWRCSSGRPCSARPSPHSMQPRQRPCRASSRWSRYRVELPSSQRAFGPRRRVAMHSRCSGTTRTRKSAAPRTSWPTITSLGSARSFGAQHGRCRGGDGQGRAQDFRDSNFPISHMHRWSRWTRWSS